MIRIHFTLFFLLTALFSQSQSLDIGIMAGGSNYQGELQDQRYNLSQMHLAVGGSLTYHFTSHLSVRGEVWKGNLSGFDTESRNQANKIRNLSFNTRLYEVSLVGVYRFLSPELHRVSPYIFGGVAGFRINPYTHDAAGSQYFLFPLSTEGQGMAQYPEIREHQLYHFAVPFGGGLKMALSDKWSVGLEMGLRVTFTDYIDDVSSGYVDPLLLLQERGDKAVELSYRGDELPGGSPLYPKIGSLRGNPETNDWYYNTVLRLQYRLFGGPTSSGSRKNQSQFACPTGF
jgi:opacity protein-like surface antigen